jgi:hypothetical protein
MFKIQTLNKIDTEGLHRFPLSNYEIASELPNPDAIVFAVSYAQYGIACFNKSHCPCRRRC